MLHLAMVQKLQYIYYLLFLIHVNDIVNVSSVLYTLLFADDTSLFLQGKNYVNLFKSMNSELEKMLNG